VSDAQRQAYQQKAEAQVEEMKAKLDQLRAKASGASADTKARLMREADDLAGSYDEAKQSLMDMIDAGDDVWEDAKLRFEGAWDGLKKKFAEYSQ
jgi:hypothetical protein